MLQQRPRSTASPNWRQLPFQVYLSHAHEDFLLVERVWRILDHIGIRSFMYEHFPHPGRTPCDAVLGAIEDSAQVVPFLTAAGVRSPWLQQELGAAIALGKQLLPVVQVDAVQSPGFTDVQQPVLLDTRHPELAIGHLLWLLRVDFEVFEGRVTLECPGCHAYSEAALPSLHALRRAMDGNHLLEGFACRSCGAAARLSPLTLEPVSEQMALGRAWPE